MTFLIWILSSCYKANLPMLARRLRPLLKFCNEKQSESLLRLIGSLRSKKLYQDALSLAHTVLLLRPTDEGILKMMGALYFQLEKPIEALPYFAQRDALLNPNEKIETRLLASSLLDPV